MLRAIWEFWRDFWAIAVGSGALKLYENKLVESIGAEGGSDNGDSNGRLDGNKGGNL